MTARQIEKRVRAFLPDGGDVILTGGEPLTQYDNELFLALSGGGYRLHAETSGAFRQKAHLDWISISPKVSSSVIRRNFSGADELRYVLRAGQELPTPAVEADHLFLSPEFDGANINPANVAWCVDLVLKNPEWRLSLQTHKLLGIR